MLEQQLEEVRFASDQPSEAGFSTNLFLNHSKMGRVQFTFRGRTSQDWGATLEDLDRFLHYMSGKGWTFDGKPQDAHEIIPAQTQEPIHQPIDDGGNAMPEVKSFIADKLSVSMNNGKYYYKVIGGVFKQYGVTVWPEILVLAGLNVSEGQPVPNIAGWRAEYIEEDGKEPGKKRMKVTRLLPPK
jgi:hypothetical protein